MNQLKDVSIAALIAGTAFATVSGVVMASSDAGKGNSDTDPGQAPAVSMEEAIAGVREAGAQRILESEYEREDGRAVYEVKYIDADGRTRETYIDAMDGSTLDSEYDD